jgi:PQQ-dependent dehydrogenase (methanol/ethanol family)
VAAGVLIGLLATGVLSKSTHSENTQVTTAPCPSCTTTSGTETTPLKGTALANNPFGPDDWGTYGGTYDQIRHSTLTAINVQNVNQLGVLCRIDFKRIDPNIPLGQESFPIVVNGEIYVTTSDAYVFAVNGNTCKVDWEYKPQNIALLANYGVNTNRGVAYCDGKIVLLTLDMQLATLDPSNGHLLQEVPLSDSVPSAKIQYGYSETEAPICYDNLVLVGASGSDFGVRGFVMAYNASDLSPAWSSPYWIIPPDGQDWRAAGLFVGGGTSWNPATIDSTNGYMYITTSNPSPLFDPQVRPGADARTDSVVCLDVYTGQQIWWQQQIAGDQWGYSTSQPVLLYNIKVNGRTQRVVSVATKEGTWWMYNAAKGTPIYTHVKLVDQEEHGKLVPGKPVTVYPSSLGGLNYSPSSFDPKTGYVVNNQSETSIILQEKPNPRSINNHKSRGDIDNGLANGSFGETPPGSNDYGSITAIDAAHGTIKWKDRVSQPGRGGITTTDSGLSFAGGGDGNLVAYATATGSQLWSFQTGHQLAAAPAIYETHGKEYLAITVGGTATSSYGGTASQMEIFGVGGSQTQYQPPQIAPRGINLGVLNSPPVYLSASASESHALRLLVIASQTNEHGANTLDGTSNGGMTVDVPKGWHVYVTFVNQATSRPDGVAVVTGPGATTPVFANATTSENTMGSVPNYFNFSASSEGTYSIASTVPSQAKAGEWLRLQVVSSSKNPMLYLPNHTPYVIVPSGHN